MASNPSIRIDPPTAENATPPARRIAVPVSEREIADLRLRTQGISAPRFRSAAEVVRWLGAVQSQEYAYAKWSLGKRATGVNERAVDEALARGEILRTHLLRPTWHYVHREDIRWVQTATAHRVRRMMKSYDRALELDDALYARANEIIARAVQGGAHRTRAELSEALAAEGIAAKGQRLGHIVMRAELDLVVCSGVTRGKQITYGLVSERAPGAQDREPEEALAELTRRYFASHGPATERDFRWWSSLTAREVRRGLEMVGSDLERLRVGDRDYWWLPADLVADGSEGARTDAHLMQSYDEYIVAYTESRDALDLAGLGASHPERVPFYHAIILGGQLVGRWRRQVRKKVMAIEIEPLRHLDAAERRALEAAVERYAHFSGLAAEVVS